MRLRDKSHKGPSARRTATSTGPATIPVHAQTPPPVTTTVRAARRPRPARHWSAAYPLATPFAPRRAPSGPGRFFGRANRQYALDRSECRWMSFAARPTFSTARVSVSGLKMHMNDPSATFAGMLPFDTMGLYEQQKPRFIFKMPRVVPDQKAKFESDELFRRLSRESEVSTDVVPGSWDVGFCGRILWRSKQRIAVEKCRRVCFVYCGLKIMVDAFGGRNKCRKCFLISSLKIP